MMREARPSCGQPVQQAAVTPSKDYDTSWDLRRSSKGYLPTKGFRAIRLEDGVPDWRAHGLPVAVGTEYRMRKPIYIDYNATTPVL